MRVAQTFAISAMLLALAAGPALGQAKKAPAGPGLMIPELCTESDGLLRT